MNRSREPLEDSCPGPLEAAAAERSRALLARARAGDREAQDALVARYQERLLRIVRIRLGPGMRRLLESGDVVQETFHAALRGLSDLQASGDAEMLHWLARIAENRIRDERDRADAQKRSPGAGREMRSLASESQRDSEPVDSQTSVPGKAYKAELREVLDQAIAELPEEYREIVLLRDFCGADWESIASRLGRESVHAAQQLHQRAWIKVRKLTEPRLRRPG